MKDATDPTATVSRGNTREKSNLDGNPREATTTHGSFTRDLAKLAKLMFTQQGPCRDIEEGDPIDSDTFGDTTATHGNLTQPMAAHGNLIRRLIMVFQSPIEAVEDLPYLTELKGNITEVTSGMTKETTANSQDPDQTINRPRPTFRSPTQSYHGVTLEKSLFTASSHFHHPLFTNRSSCLLLPYSPPHHHLFITPSYLPYPPHYHYSPSTLITNGYILLAHHHFFPFSPSLHPPPFTSQIHHINHPTAKKSGAPSLSMFSSHHNQSRITPPPLISPTAPLIITPRNLLQRLLFVSF